MKYLIQTSTTRAAREEKVRRVIAARKAAPSLGQYAKTVYPKFEQYRHVRTLEEKLEAVAAGEIRRLMVFEPPRHGKSLLGSRIFPAYFLRRRPDGWVGLAAHTADLARTFSRSSRDCFELSGGSVRRDVSATTHWETTAGGGMWAAGVGGPITGKGFHVGIIDDPIKNSEEAASSVMRQKQWDWYQSTFATREEPGGAIILTMTRWDEDDLAGRLLEQEESGESEDRWHIVHLPAIRDASMLTEWPATCTVSEDWREDGEPLCPERYGLEKLNALRRRIGEYFWLSLFQGVPRTVVGQGRVYHKFDGNSLADVDDPGDCPLLVGMDFNVDPMSACIAVRVADQLHVIDEIELRDAGTDEMCKALKDAYPDSKIIVYPDPACRQRRTSAPVGQTDLAIIRRHGFATVVPSSAPPVVDRINEVNTLFESGRGFVNPRCRSLCRGLERLTYRPGTSLIQKSKGYDHMTDALGYLVHGEFPLVSRGSAALRLR